MIKAFLDWLLLNSIASKIKETIEAWHKNYLTKRVFKTENELLEVKLKLSKLENKDEIDKKYNDSSDADIIKSITSKK